MKVKKQTGGPIVKPLAKTIKVKRDKNDTSEQTTVGKALESAKKLLESKKLRKEQLAAKQAIPKSLRPQKQKVIVRKAASAKPRVPRDRPERGVVYIGHIPHGFYEDQMKDYFTQFGKVTRVRVARSRNSGNSRGYGFVEFVEPEVAKIAAETMNNYLMCGRLLKTTYISPEKQHNRYFRGKHWSKQEYPKLITREKNARLKNSLGTAKVYKKFVERTKTRLSALEKKLKEKGVDINLQDLVVDKS